VYAKIPMQAGEPVTGEQDAGCGMRDTGYRISCILDPASVRSTTMIPIKKMMMHPATANWYPGKE